MSTAAVHEEPDDSPEYFEAKEKWIGYLKRTREGLERGHDDDITVAIARLAHRFGVTALESALEEFIANLPSNFDRYWRERHEARTRQREENVQRMRNPKKAGRRRKRSDEVLMGAWLIVQKCMGEKKLNARDACKLIAKPPSRRETSWPGLLLYCDYTTGERYYVQTPANLRDIYSDAVARYKSGPEGLRRSWKSFLHQLMLYRGPITAARR